jgi:hypothetical protein
MFARFCGFGPGHKSTHHVTKVFRDEIKEAFGLVGDDMGDAFEVQPREYADEDKSGDKSDGPGESEDSDSENSDSEDSDIIDLPDRDDIEGDLGYAPL